MKILNGVDIIEISRIQENIEKYGDKFLLRVYTINEIQYCEARKSQKYASYAARFAAKEAVFKAISSKTNEVHEWTDIEIINDNSGKPNVFINKNVDDLEYIEISLSHSKEYAVANAVAVYKEKFNGIF